MSHQRPPRIHTPDDSTLYVVWPRLDHAQLEAAVDQARAGGYTHVRLNHKPLALDPRRPRRPMPMREPLEPAHVAIRAGIREGYPPCCTVSYTIAGPLLGLQPALRAGVIRRHRNGDPSDIYVPCVVHRLLDPRHRSHADFEREINQEQQP
jgi:hypothetical protein